MRKLLKLTSDTAKKRDLELTEQDKILPKMYWLPQCIRHHPEQDSLLFQKTAVLTPVRVKKIKKVSRSLSSILFLF